VTYRKREGLSTGEIAMGANIPYPPGGSFMNTYESERRAAGPAAPAGESGKPARPDRGGPRPVVFLDRDGVVNEEVSHLSDPAQFRLISGAAEAIRRLNQSGFLVIVVTNQSVIARGGCSIETLRLIHSKMDTLLAQEHARIDALYFCPHHPDKGIPGEIPELKIDCDCRKPKTGMFEQAVRDWNISLPGSYAVGDSRRDVIAARRMGIVAIGVKTGHGCRDCDDQVLPDLLVADLREAVDFILASSGKTFTIRAPG
jgi:mannose-1-phosphate guanylyltransferase / phosphomannomutase